jgi:predicted metal-dependent HD superfamily phosphohydrolase
MLLVDQWRKSWSELGVSITPALLQDFNEIIARYSESHRRYHTTRHLEECFEKLAEVRILAQRPAEIEIALWFHDAIYDTQSHQNESASAQLAHTKVLAFGGSVESATRISQLIMATRHDVVPEDTDAKVLVDVDLSILGASAERFAEYEQQVREEYSRVPEPVFTKERKRILQQLLARASIFNTQLFTDRYEQQARDNLQRSISRLGA